MENSLVEIVELTVKTLLSHLITRKFSFPADSLWKPYCRTSSPTQRWGTNPRSNAGSHMLSQCNTHFALTWIQFWGVECALAVIGTGGPVE
eukprot:4949478-Pyramimonas_sp.AAC.1